MKAGRLIPGLPDCVALHCLLHLPFHAIPVARVVCKRWNRELTSPSFYRLRKATGLAPRVVMLLFRAKLSHTVGMLHLALYEPATDICCMIWRLPANRTNNMNGCNRGVIVVGRELLVIGGRDKLNNRRTGKVNIYDLLSGAWRKGAPMPTPVQPSCRFCLNEGKLFVVGLIDADGKKLRPALVYDVAIDTWLEMPPDSEHNTCRESLCHRFWRRNGEYDRAIQFCKRLSLLNKKDLSLHLRTTMDKKKIIVMRIPIKKSSEKVEMEEVTLSAPFLETLRRQLGLRPNEIDLYLESCFTCHL